MIGRRLSHYLIEERLGAGGMGEVYRARDEKLGRDVALKVLPPRALGDDEARRRFRKEAVVLSRLSHPHIATLFDFDSADGIDFLVMELVLGPTLEQELRQGPLAEKDVLRLGSQLARGLVAAHEQGVVHRDLKPSNLQLTADGMLKILDFGVARLERASSSRSDTETATETSPGDVIGSPPYMSPEQLLGKAVDARTDVYAAGASLYEMATGQRPHGDKHGAALTEAILHEAVPSPRSKRRALSAGLEAVILKCLDKEPALRYQTAKELAVDLERLQASTTARSASQPVAVKPRRRWPWLVGAGTLLATVATAGWLLRPLPTPRVMAVRPLTGEVPLGTGSTPLLGGAATDGVRVYYLARVAGRTDLLQAPVGGGDPVEVPLPFGFNHRCVLRYVPGEGALLMLGTGERINDDAPDFGVPLWLVPVPTGTARRIPNLRARWADLSRDGRTLVLVRGQSGRNHRLYLARLDGTGERPLIEVRSGVGVVRWAPDGRRLRFASPGPPGHERETWIWETSVDGEVPRPLCGGHSGGWTEDGERFVYSGPGNQLFALSESRGWPGRQEAQPLTIGPLAYTFVQSEPAGRWLLAIGAMFRREPLRRDAVTGRWEPALGAESAIGIEPSPDRQWLTWVRLPDASLWRSRADGSERLRLTAPGVEASQPRWSPDGRAIVFVGRASDDRQRTVRVVAADGSSAEVVARPGIPTADYWDPCWLPDGSIVFSHLETERLGANGLLRYDPGTRRTDRLAGAEELRYPRCSARGDLLAVGRAETEGFHYWTRRAGATTWSAIGTFPLSYPNWRRDGRAFCGLNWLDRSAYSVDCVSVDSGRVERTFALGPVVPMVWHAARWSGLDGDDQPLVVAERSRTALYALDWETP